METIILNTRKDKLETELFFLETSDSFTATQWNKFNTLHYELRNLADALKNLA